MSGNGGGKGLSVRGKTVDGDRCWPLGEVTVEVASCAC